DQRVDRGAIGGADRVALVLGLDDGAPVGPVVVGVVAGAALRQLVGVEDGVGGPVREARREAQGVLGPEALLEDLPVDAVTGVGGDRIALGVVRRADVGLDLGLLDRGRPLREGVVGPVAVVVAVPSQDQARLVQVVLLDERQQEQEAAPVAVVGRR